MSDQELAATIETVTTAADTVPVLPKELRNDDPALLDQLFERFTRTGRDALSSGTLLPCRTITFDVDGADCEPDVFVTSDGDYYVFSLTLKSLLPEEELKALDGVTNPSAAAMVLAKAMLWKLNGKIIPIARRDWLWQALGMRGRNSCFVAFQQIGGATSRSMGKLQASISIGSTAM